MEPHRHNSRRLFARSPYSVGHMLAVRVLLVVGLLLSLIAILWWDREGLRDHLDGEISFTDVIYFTAVSVTTVGYGDVVPVTDRARMIDAVVVTPVRLFIWLLFLGTAYELVLQKWIEGWRMKRMQENLKAHAIVCGFGDSGRSAARELAARGKTVLVVDRDPAMLQLAADAGYLGLLGDATRSVDLRAAAIDKANTVLVCLGRDDAAVLATLTIRDLCAQVRIVCSVRELDNLKIIRQAGADATVLPSQVGGYLMADATRTHYVTDYVTDLLTVGGRVSLNERAPKASEIGRRMREIESEIVLRIYRGGVPVGFWEGEHTVIRENDVLLTIVPTDKGAT